MPMLIMSSQWGGNWLPIGQLLLLRGQGGRALGDLWGLWGLSRGCLDISLKFSVQQSASIYIPSGID